MRTIRTIFFLALRHLVVRKRQSLVATIGLGIGVAVLIAMTALMKGLELKFLHETLRISPHVTITDEEVEDAPAQIAREEAAGRAVATAAQGRAAAREHAPLERGAAERPGAPRGGEARYDNDAGVIVGTRHGRPADRPRRIKRPGDLARHARELPDVVAAAPARVGQAAASFGGKLHAVEVRGVELREQEKVTPLESYVTAGAHGELANRLDTIILCSDVAAEIGASVGDRVMVAAPGRAGVSLEVVALLEIGIPLIDKVRVYVPLRTAQTLLGRPQQVNTIGLRLDDPDRADAVAATLTATTGYEAESWREQNANWLGVFTIQQVITQIIVAAIVVVAAFGILNILIMIVMEKKRDIAILRSVGLTRVDIQRIFLVEGSIMGIAGALVGCVLGWLIIYKLERTYVHAEGIVKMDKFWLDKDPWYYVLAAAFALVAALLASILPARRAASTEPVDVIRGQA